METSNSNREKGALRFEESFANLTVCDGLYFLIFTVTMPRLRWCSMRRDTST